MPWRCQVCGKPQEGQKGGKGHGPLCYETQACKVKGKFACTWENAPVVQPVLTDEQRARALGYPMRYNSYADNFTAGHKTGVMYVNKNMSRGISPDGSTHMGDREGWKGFTKSAKGWNYSGSFRTDLQPWEHRANDAQVAFPRGNE
jgi:hypothetical protein